MRVQVLALDLERTLISDALSARPRPGLFEFLMFCNERFARVALFTCVDQVDAHEILTRLTTEGFVPPEFMRRLECVEWCGEYKDLSFVPNATPEEILLVDDDPSWVRPDQRDRLVAIAAWDGGKDRELHRMRTALELQTG